MSKSTSSELETDNSDTSLPSNSSSDAPPLRVKVTGYRLLNVAVLLSFGVSKAYLSYQGQSIVPTVFDWLLGVFFAVVLYWLGLYENVNPPVWPGFFHKDYTWYSVTLPLQILSIYAASFLILSLILLMWMFSRIYFFFVLWIMRACRNGNGPLWMRVCAELGLGLCFIYTYPVMIVRGFKKGIKWFETSPLRVTLLQTWGSVYRQKWSLIGFLLLATAGCSTALYLFPYYIYPHLKEFIMTQ